MPAKKKAAAPAAKKATKATKATKKATDDDEDDIIIIPSPSKRKINDDNDNNEINNDSSNSKKRSKVNDNIAAVDVSDVSVVNDANVVNTNTNNNNNNNDNNNMDIVINNNDNDSKKDISALSYRSNESTTTSSDDKLITLASEYWGSKATKGFNEKILKTIYLDEILQGRLHFLEFSGYLESYLWKYYTATSSLEHVESIIILINEKFRDGLQAFDILTSDKDKFQSFFESIVTSYSSFSDQQSLITFLINSYRSLENEIVRKCVLKYVSIAVWAFLSPFRLKEELDASPALKKHWEYHLSQNNGKKSMDSTWIPTLIKNFIEIVESNASSNLKFLERFAELLIDLLSQLPTRRFLNVLIDDFQLVVRCRRSISIDSPECKLLNQLIDSIDSYIHFEINDQTGQALTVQERLSLQSSKIHKLQQIAFTDYKNELKDLVFSSLGELGKVDVLEKYLKMLDDSKIIELAEKLGYSTTVGTSSASIALDFIVHKVIPRKSKTDELNRLSLYPDETLLWDENQVPMVNDYNGTQVLALPKLNLQFLTVHDYLLRNFILYRLESAYEIREDIVDAVKRMGPKMGLRGTVFAGWARMALHISSLSIDEVLKSRLGETVPRRVSATVNVDYAKFNGDIREEWESLREHDVIFLIGIENPKPEASAALSIFEQDKKAGKKRIINKELLSEEMRKFVETYGIKYIRGGEIFEVRDEDGTVISDPFKPVDRRGNKRSIRINLDPVQYNNDMNDGINCYETLNLIIRRDSKENNFKAILETIRDLMNSSTVDRSMPPWLHDVFLGYGNPNSASFRVLASKIAQVSGSNDFTEEFDYADTFFDSKHLIESFPGHEVSFELKDSPPPYKTKIVHTFGENQGPPTVSVQSYVPPNVGPYPDDQLHQNAVKFSSAQVEAIRSGMNPGLTLIVGPPGTGKTDVAVQIIANLYKNFPSQKILIVTHSNSALNDLFEKIMQRNIDPRHLLRLGSGERELRDNLAVGGALGGGKGQGEQFSKQGRVNWTLARRLKLLEQVHRLGATLGIMSDVGSSCETAEYFFHENVKTRIETFEKDISTCSSQTPSFVAEKFPFAAYFMDTQKPIFGKQDFAQDLESAEGCIRHIKKVFDELADYRAFELLRTQAHRTDYLLTKQARIVAMTCTHAAMNRRRLIEIGFKYDSIIMEEAAQILEVETLIPFLLQDTDPVDGCRLKRAILIGDHFQLPPIVQSIAIQKYSKLDQSLFTRFIRLGVPYVLLDKQGRARSELSDLYRWRYSAFGKNLGNIDNVLSQPEFERANAGFLNTFQLINVPPFQEQGEFCPTPHFYQNLGEAEYVVAVYQFMRLIGYPARKISIITTYNGQKHLIRDIINQRCRGPLFGKPATITTVDKYQGQQNDFILLSLVRTESVGHIRDVRRLVVAMSRARLGLYVFCRQNVFENCHELSPTFNILKNKPTKLQLVVGENYGDSLTRKVNDKVKSDSIHEVSDVTAMGVLVYQMSQIKAST